MVKILSIVVVFLENMNFNIQIKTRNGENDVQIDFDLQLIFFLLFQ